MARKRRLGRTAEWALRRRIELCLERCLRIIALSPVFGALGLPFFHHEK